MHRSVGVVPQNTMIVAVTERMTARVIGSVLVESAIPKEGFRVAGIVKEGDVVRGCWRRKEIPMIMPVQTIASNRPMIEACHLTSPVPVSVDCPVDYSKNLPLSERVAALR
jgi:hypothetical protein